MPVAAGQSACLLSSQQASTMPIGLRFRITGSRSPPSPYPRIWDRATPSLTIFGNPCMISSMNISLTPELESAVRAKVASGLYNNASEIIREALRESLRRESENQWLQREAAIGFAQLEAGQVTRVNSKREFLAAVRKDL